MNRLFSKSEINALKDSIRKQKNAYTHHTDNDVEKEKIHELNNLYCAILGVERNMKKSSKERTLK